MVTLTEIINLLEAEIPANPNSPANVRKRDELERKLAKYFTSLEKAFPYSSIDKIYNKYVTESEASDERKAIDPLLATFTVALTAILLDAISTTYQAGYGEMGRWAVSAELITGFDTIPSEAAIKYARSHISNVKLVDGINEETRKQISQVISDGIKNKRGVPGIKTDIKRRLNWMARGAPSDIKGLTLDSRAMMIARTETSDALSQASLDSMKDMGIEGKEWVVNQPCDICLANEADGVIPVGQAFSSGDMAPPAHPNCECALAPALLKK